MIPISWDQNTKRWVHHQQDQDVFWGSDQVRIPYHPESNTPTFKCHISETIPTKVGPLLGILSSKKPEVPFIGNVEMFKQISNYVHSKGGIVFTFTLEDISENAVIGYVYDRLSDRWIKAVFPYPDFVYNRIAYRSDEEESPFFRFVQLLQQRSIPFFNRGFFSKWYTYLAFQNSSELTPHLPETRLLTSHSQLDEFLVTHENIIIKPIRSSQGKGVFSLSKIDADRILYFSNHEVITYHRPEFIEQINTTLAGDCIMQPMIKRKTYKGRPYDYRILVQKLSGKWHVTGIGVRWAGIGKLTTHVPAGGEIVSIEEVPVDFQPIKALAEAAGVTLERFYQAVGEFSMDIGVDRSNHYWLFEVNSKPMVFDEPNIQMNSTERFYVQVLEATGFLKGNDIFLSTYTHTS